MIDGLKIHSLPVLPENIEKNHILDFPLSNVSTSGELLNRTQVAKYKSLDFLIRNKEFNGMPHRYIGLKGSPHKYDQEGKNFLDFSFLDIRRVVNEWTELFDFAPQKATINFIEIGINVPVDVDPTTLIKSFVIYKHKSFEPLKTTGTGFGRICCMEQFQIKVYNKSLQNDLPYYLLRFEIKVTRMQFLKQFGIYRLTLADLKRHDLYPKFLKMLLEVFDHILIYNPNLDIGSIKDRKNRELVIEGKYPEYWQNLARTTKSNRIKKFSDLAGTDSLKHELKQLIKKKWNELTTLKESLNPHETERINNTINCYSHTCLVTGVNISMQKGNSRLLSNTGLNWLKENQPKLYEQLKRNFLPRKGVSGQHTKFEGDEINHLSHQIRNRYYNQRSKTINSDNQTGLFN